MRSHNLKKRVLPNTLARTRSLSASSAQHTCCESSAVAVWMEEDDCKNVETMRGEHQRPKATDPLRT
eukprot:scaffold292497_cov32-Tisochrysis_lutea.AAC.2